MSEQMNDSEVWVRLGCAYSSGAHRITVDGRTVTVVEFADTMLEEYRKRFGIRKKKIEGKK